MERNIKKRLEYLREQIREECVSYGEIVELQSLKEHIEEGDVELLEYAGVPEFEEENEDEATKDAIQKEILAILDNQIEEEISMMKMYTVAEIAREVLLDVKNDVVKF